MSYSIYPLGTLVRVGATFHRVTDSAEVEPDDVVCQVVDPAGNVTTPDVTHDDDHDEDEPEYYADLDANVAGVWKYRFYSTGNGQAAEKGSFQVEPGITS